MMCADDDSAALPFGRLLRFVPIVSRHGPWCASGATDGACDREVPMESAHV